MIHHLPSRHCILNNSSVFFYMYKPQSHASKVKSEIRRNEIFGDKDPIIKAFIGMGGLGGFKTNARVDFVGYAQKNTYFGLIQTLDEPTGSLLSIDSICAPSDDLGAIPILIVYREYCSKVHFYDRDGVKLKSLV